MASLSEMIAYAEWKRSQQLPDPSIISGMNSIAGAIKNIQANKQKNRIYNMISKDPSKYKMTIDDDGKVTYTFDPTKNKEKKVYDMGDKLVKYDPDDDSTSVLFDNESPDKTIERRIKSKQANGEDLSRSEMDYYNRNMTSSALRMPYNIPEEEDPEDAGATPKPQYDPSGVRSWRDVPLHRRIIAAITPSATPEEKSIGKLKPGGVVAPPKTKADAEIPSNVKTTSEAVKHLQKKYGMTQAEAVEWIRGKNRQ